MKELVEAWRKGHCPEVGKVLVEGLGAELYTPVPMPRLPCGPKGWIQLATLPLCPRVHFPWNWESSALAHRFPKVPEPPLPR